MKTYTGGCHCGAVRYEVTTGLEKVIECNCSHCSKKGFLLNFVERDQFTLQTSEDMLMEYFFNQKTIRHLFCRVCGVQSFAEGVTFPKVAINVRCLDGIDVSSLSPELVNGKDF
ncbi:MAG TPA: GFA family protein [Candidatus Paceibacterota bacterium]|jgi:hypothetical protein